MAFPMNLTISHAAPTICLCHTWKPFQLQAVLNNCASWSFTLLTPRFFFFCFCSAETQTRPLQGWKLAVYSSSQFPIPQQVFSMTEPYVLHSMPLSIHFWPTVKIFALTTQIQNTQWFFNPFGINSLLQQFSLKKQITKSSLTPHSFGPPPIFTVAFNNTGVEGGHPCWETALHSKCPLEPHTTAARGSWQCHSGPPYNPHSLSGQHSSWMGQN